MSEVADIGQREGRVAMLVKCAEAVAIEATRAGGGSSLSQEIKPLL